MSKQNQRYEHPEDLLMFDVTESVLIDASQEDIWEAMQDFEGELGRIQSGA